MPGNCMIYIEEFRKLISFDAVKPDNILKRIDPEWSVKHFMDIQQEQLSAA